MLIRLFKHISRQRRYQFAGLVLLTVISSFAEVISLGAVVPFIGIITQPETVFKTPIVSRIAIYFGINSAHELILPLTFSFIAAAVLAGAMRLLLLWIGIRLANATGADLSTEVYRRTLYQPYRVHIDRSSSEIIAGITQKVATATSLLLSLVTVLTSIVLFIAIFVTLILIDPLIATLAMLIFGASYGCIVYKTRQRLRRNSESIALQQTQVIKILQEGLGSIRDVLLDGSQLVYCNTYQKSIRQLQYATGENSYITIAPRYVMETLGLVLTGVFVCIISGNEVGGVSGALPVLGALALGAQRLLPLLQLIYCNWTFVIGSQASLKDVLDLLEQPLPENAKQDQIKQLDFQRSIRFENVSFKYGVDLPLVLKQINFTIPKGGRIGIVGSTGSGKSTVLDLLMLLLKPTHGKILIDDCAIGDEVCQAWQKNIAHVPQSIYLADATLAENIAFGIPFDQIDFHRVKLAASQAQLSEFIENKPKSYYELVGERGVRLSGGQRQRIGIARALYKQANVLIFDEATSALDNGTECDVMRAIEDLGNHLTICMVAHRLTTLEKCDQIIEFRGGMVHHIGDYQSVVQGSKSTRTHQ